MWLLPSTTVLVLIFHLCHGAAPGTDGSLDNPNVKVIVEKEAEQYLAAFGYMSHPKTLISRDRKSLDTGKHDLHVALKRLQNAFLLYQSGVVDVPTQSKISEYRCGNKDMFNGEELHDLPRNAIWKKRILQWKITSFPSSLTVSQIREACDEAFEKWRQVSGIDFVEANNASKADIVISFDILPNSFLNVAAHASPPLNSWIVLNKNLLWGYREPVLRGISIFHTLLHGIGHTLGLHHNFYRGSIMYPMLKPAIVPYGSLGGVPDVDKLILNKLYGLADTRKEKWAAGLHTYSKCPKHIDSVAHVTQYEWLVFRESKVYHVKGRRFVDSGREIQNVFPKAPGFVNATVTSGNLVLLFVERTIYGYVYDGVVFSEAPNFPRELHELVLFYPQAAFPLNNGSVILLSGNVFATYDVLDNVPSFLNDKTRYFPNLPDDLRSGIPQDLRSNDRYWMFDEKTVSDYDMQTRQILQLFSITDFLKCT